MKDAALSLVISTQGRVLCVSRPEPPFEMAIPGGEVEDGETRQEAAARELFEETGLETRASRIVWVGSSPTDGRTVYVYRAWATGTPRAVEPGTRVSWLTPGELVGQGATFGLFTKRMFESVRL
jgi:8-oxo-dGTP diphosphatase